MAKKKKSKALFEVLSQTQSSLHVPEWIKPRSDAPVRDASVPAETPAEVEAETSPESDEDAYVSEEADQASGVTIEYEAPPPADEETDAEEGPPEENGSLSPPEKATVFSPRFFRAKWRSASARQGQPVRLFLNPRTVLTAIGVAMVLLLAAFLLGLVTAGRTSSNPARPETPSSDAQPLDISDAPVECESGRRDPDRYFLVFQTLRGNGDADKQEADRILRFCRAQNLPADMVELRIGQTTRVAVWSLLGFRFRNSRDALEHARTLERVGRAYFDKYKTYSLSQRPGKDQPLRPRFYPGRLEYPQ